MTSFMQRIYLDLVYETIIVAPFNRGSIVQAVFLTWLSLPVQTVIFWIFLPLILTAYFEKVFDQVMGHY